MHPETALVESCNVKFVDQLLLSPESVPDIVIFVNYIVVQQIQ